MTLTTFTIASSNDDGDVKKTSNAYPPVGATTVELVTTTVELSRSLSGANFTIRPMIIAWDTSSLIDVDLITGATLEIDVTSVNNADTRNIQGEWYTGYTGSIVAGDYTTTPSSTAFTIAISAMVSNGINTITLTNPDANINKAGITALRLHVDGGQPTGLNRIFVATFDNVGGRVPAKLNVTSIARDPLRLAMGLERLLERGLVG